MSHEIGKINKNMDKYIKIMFKCNFKKASFRLDYICKSLISARDRLTRVWARLIKVLARLGLVLLKSRFG